MRLRVHKPLPYGASLRVVGSTAQLGRWRPADSRPLQWTPGHMWQCDLPVPRAPARLEFKLLIAASDGAATWEPGSNHALVIPVRAAPHAALDVTWAHPQEHVPPHGSVSPSVASPPPTPAPAPPPTRALLDRVADGLVPSPRVTFRVAPPESPCRLYVAGSHPALGSWNKLNAPRMDPASGRLFELAVPLPAALKFEYKYFLRRPDGTRRWEAGPNRVAYVPQDPSSAQPNGTAHATENHHDEHSKSYGNPDSRELQQNPHSSLANGALVLDDRWERVRIEFSIYYPARDAQIMHVTGDLPQIGAWFKPGPTPLALGEVEKLETDVAGRKWRLNIWVDPSTHPFSYRYILIDKRSGHELWEREPNRRAEFDLEEPVINSVRYLRDVNFVSEMMFDHVPPDMFIGPYPQSVADVDAMAAAGVTGVFNVQTDEDFKHRAIQWDVIKRRYDEHSIKAVRFPIRDFDRDSLRKRLHAATHALHDMFKEGRQVYIHCTAGMGRAPACAVAYLCWVKKMELMEAVAFVKKHRKVAVPNVPVLEQALKHAY